MADTLASDRSDQRRAIRDFSAKTRDADVAVSFGEVVLPRRAWGNRLVADAHARNRLVTAAP